MVTTATIGQGKIKGGRSTTASGFKYFEFLGIPYARPPVGELRFQRPRSPEPWQGVRDATATDASTISCQRDPLTGSAKGNEDCLYLNVYTPHLQICNEPLRPVMVYIHGGGFVAGSGTLKTEYGPDYLIEHDVVIVTINYRLGILGFLNLGIPEASGNMGLKDQIKALQWIQNNIYKFSGDKDNVTIFGSSSGSVSCEYLMLSHYAQGLFHKCILHSGSTLNSWGISDSRETRMIAEKLAMKMGYTGCGNNMREILQVLLKSSASELTLESLKLVGEAASHRLCFGFVPSIEHDYGNNCPFIISPPYTLLKEGRFTKVPVIRGFCNKEGKLVSVMKPNAIKEVMKNKSFADFLQYPFDNRDVAAYNSKLKAAYINYKPQDFPDEYAVDFFGDLYIAAGVYLAGKMQCKYTPVYMYNFCYEGNLNRFKVLFKLDRKGAGHSDEIGYILRIAGLSTQVSNDADLLMRNRLVKMWTNFAKTGNPTPICSGLPVKWPLFTENCHAYLNIDKEFTIKCHYEPKKMYILEKIMDNCEL